MLLEKINKDLKSAVKKGDVFYVSVLRMMLAVFKNKEIEKRGKGEQAELSDEEIIEILSKEAKKRKETVQIYSSAGRKDLADKESKEILIIHNYLPAQASPEEIEKIVMETIAEVGDAGGPKNFGLIMAAAVKKLKGRAESALIADIIKKNMEK